MNVLQDGDKEEQLGWRHGEERTYFLNKGSRENNKPNANSMGFSSAVTALRHSAIFFFGIGRTHSLSKGLDALQVYFYVFIIIIGSYGTKIRGFLRS